MKGLTEKQRAVLRIIGEQLLRRGAPPCLREIGRRIGVTSTCTVQRHVEALRAKGYLPAERPYAYRAYALTSRGWLELNLGPCCGCGRALDTLPELDERGRSWHPACAKKALARLREAVAA